MKRLGGILQIYGVASIVVGISLSLKTTPGTMFLAGTTLILIATVMRLAYPKPGEIKEV